MSLSYSALARVLYFCSNRLSPSSLVGMALIRMSMCAYSIKHLFRMSLDMLFLIWARWPHVHTYICILLIIRILKKFILNEKRKNGWARPDRLSRNDAGS